MSLMALLLVLFPSFAGADEIFKSQTERATMIEWVSDNAAIDLSAAKVKSIITQVYQRAAESQLDPLLILSVIKVESGFKERSVSSGGAKGLLQVIPFWHRDKFKGRNPMNPAVSIEVGTRVLKECWDKSSGNRLKTLSCYSGGGGKKYYNKVMAQFRDMRRSVVMAQFKRHETLYASYTPFSVSKE
jgi:soluble lytic murein transglycosylase-like protein